MKQQFGGSGVGTFLLNVAVYFRDARGVRWKRDAERGELEEIPPGEEIPGG